MPGWLRLTGRSQMSSGKMLKKPASVFGKVKAEVKAEMKQVESSLNLDLNLSLLHSLRPRWTAILSILQKCFSHWRHCSAQV